MVVFVSTDHFFKKCGDERKTRLLPILLLILTPIADFIAKAVIFYKVGKTSFTGQEEWAQVGGGYFGAIIGQQIAFGLKYALFLVACYAIARRIKSQPSTFKLINLSGYCFVPMFIGCLLLTGLYAGWLEIPVIDLFRDADVHIISAITLSPIYSLQRLIIFNVVAWMVFLVLAMLRVYWRTQFSQTLLLLTLTIASIEAIDRLVGLTLQRVLAS